VEGASRFVVDLDFFGVGPRFALEPLGGHEEVQEGGQRLAGGGQEGLFLKAFEPVIANVFTDNGAVFFVRPGPEVRKQLSFFFRSREREGFFSTPDFGGVVDKFRAAIARKLCFRLWGIMENWNSGKAVNLM
jgi:hypothetical protein